MIEDIVSKQQEFLKGHTGVISCIACSSSGRYLASGQVTHMGFKVACCVVVMGNHGNVVRLTS